MKKVLFVVPDLKMGGIQRVSSVISSELSHDYYVDLLTYDREPPFYDLSISHHFSLSKLEYLRLLSGKAVRKASYSLCKKKLNPNFVYKSLIRKVLKLQKKYRYETIVLVASALLISTDLKKILPNTKIISWIHNNANTYFNSYFKREGRHFYSALSNADSLVVLTDVDKEAFSKYNPKTFRIYNPLTIENTKQTSLETPMICFVGRLSIQHKGIDYLCKLITMLPREWKVSIAGNGTDTEKRIFKELVKKNNIKDRIVYRGPLKDEELKNHFLNSSIFIMTSRWEGLPLVLAEAMSFGLPIVSFEQTGSNEILDYGKYGILVSNGDVNEMAVRVNELINDFNKRVYWSNKSLERVNDFNITSIIEEWKWIL